MTCSACRRTVIGGWEVDGQRRIVCAGCIAVFLRSAGEQLAAESLRRQLGRQTMPWRL